MSTSAQVETYFDPEDDLERRVADEIGRARVSVWIQAYKFSSETIVDTLLRLKQAHPGLDVRLSLDAKEAASKREKKQGRLADAIAAAGGEVRFVADADKSHSKFIIVDAAVVITGSFNFKPHPDRVQRDNIVVIRSPDVAQTYATSFQDTLTSAHIAAGEGRADTARPAPTAGAGPAPSDAGPANRRPAGDADLVPAPSRAATAAPASWLHRRLRLGTSAGRAFSGAKWPLSAATAALVLLLGTVGLERFEQALEPDADFEFSGIVEALPPDGLVGTWQIGGRAVQVTETTEIERTSTSPAIGNRVAVEGTILADQSISAVEIELGDDD